MSQPDALRQMLLRLPLTDEQWEPDMAAVLRHDGPRLAAIARLAVRASEGPTLDLGIGYGYSSGALRAAGRKWIVGVEHPSRDLVRGPDWRTRAAFPFAMHRSLWFALRRYLSMFLLIDAKRFYESVGECAR